MENEITQSDINRLIAACMLCASKYDTMKGQIYKDEAKKYKTLESKLRRLCYDENRKLLVSEMSIS